MPRGERVKSNVESLRGDAPEALVTICLLG